LGIGLAAVWAALILLERKTPGSTAPLAIGIVGAGAGVTIMYSGYASGGLVGFPLGAAVIGASLAAMLMPKPAQLQGVVGLGVVGVFSLLLSAHFFSELNRTYAVLLFFGLLLCWLPEVPAKIKGVSRLAVAAIPVILIVFLAKARFTEIESAKNPKTKEQHSNGIVITDDDYSSFGK
jgi:hypothetical protein